MRRQREHVISIVVAMVLAGALHAPPALGAHKSPAALARQAALRAEARQQARAAALARAARAREERLVARETARFCRLYGRRVGRWYRLVHRYFPGREAEALYVMRGESGGDRYASNGTCRGLWQIHQCHARKFRAVTGRPYFDAVYSPEANAAMTAYMTKRGRDWSAWSVRP